MGCTLLRPDDPIIVVAPRLAKIDRAIASATKMKDVLDIHAGLAALQTLAEQSQQAHELQNEIAERKLRIQRRGGAILRQLPKNKGGRPLKTVNSRLKVSPSPEEPRIHPMQSSRWRRLASIPDEMFERYISEAKRNGHEITQAEALRIAHASDIEKNHSDRRAQLERKAAQAPTSDLWTLIHGDCIDGLAQLEPGTIRLAVADPPYNIGIDYGDHIDDRRDLEEYLDWSRRWMQAVRHVLTDDGSMWVVISHDHELDARLTLIAVDEFGFTLRQRICWYERFGCNCSEKFNRCSRAILWLTVDPDVRVFNFDAVTRPSDRQTKYNNPKAAPWGKLLDDVWDDIPRLTSSERIPGFPTQLPLALMRRIVGVASEPGDLVCDPFAGSATTGAAAIESQRRFIGFELGARYADLARVRLQACASAELRRG